MSAAGARARNSSSVLLAVATLAIGLDVGVARITYGVVLPVVARDLQLSLTAAGLLGTLHLIGYLLGTLASPSLNAKVGALALCRASHFVFACAMLVCGLTSEVTTMAAGRIVAGVAAGFGVFSIFLIVFDATEPEKRSTAGIARLVRHRHRDRRALGAVLLSGKFARRIALSAALGSGAIGSLLVVHGENWSVFAASVLVGLGSVATPAIVTSLIRNRTSDAAYPFFFTVGTASLGLGQLSGPAVAGLVADWFGPSAIGLMAAAIYGAGMFAAAADGFFGQRQWTMTTSLKEDRHALPAS